MLTRAADANIQNQRHPAYVEISWRAFLMRRVMLSGVSVPRPRSLRASSSSDGGAMNTNSAGMPEDLMARAPCTSAGDSQQQRTGRRWGA